MASTKPILGVIIPAYNEERSVAQVIRRVLLEPSVQRGRFSRRDSNAAD